MNFVKKRLYYLYNPKTLAFEKVQPSLKVRFSRALVNTLAGIGILASIVLAVLFFMDSPKERELKYENQELRAQHKLLSKELQKVEQVLIDLQERDNNMYRTIMDAEPIANNIRRGSFDGTGRYHDLERLNDASLIISNAQKTDEIKRRVYLQIQSYDELVNLTQLSSKKMQCIPAIQPIFNRNMRSKPGPFGYRKDPIYGSSRFHAGMDFPAPTGTKIYATGDAKVSFVGWRAGYGNVIELNHGFAYKTLYAHLHQSYVKAGQTVERGAAIGEVGDTGRSFGSHLHYEVVYKGERVNPINYYFMDLTPAQYDELLKSTANHGKILD